MIEIIGLVSSLVTCFLFLLYIIGHIWTYVINKEFRYEKFQIVEADDMEDIDNMLVIDEVGTTFSVSSDEGIRKVSIYNVIYDINDSGKLVLVEKMLKKRHGIMYPKQKVYIKADIREVVPRLTQYNFIKKVVDKLAYNTYNNITIEKQ